LREKLKKYIKKLIIDLDRKKSKIKKNMFLDISLAIA